MLTFYGHIVKACCWNINIKNSKDLCVVKMSYVYIVKFCQFFRHNAYISKFLQNFWSFICWCVDFNDCFVNMLIILWIWSKWYMNQEKWLSFNFEQVAATADRKRGQKKSERRGRKERAKTWSKKQLAEFLGNLCPKHRVGLRFKHRFNCIAISDHFH